MLRLRRAQPDPAPLLLRQATDRWEGPGLVALTDQHLIFEADGAHRRTSLRTIVKAEWAGDAVWVQRRRAHDWLLYLADEAAAERVWRTLAEAIGEEGR